MIVDEQRPHLGVRTDRGAVVLRGGEEAQRQPHRVHRAIRDPHRCLQLGVEVRLERQCFAGRQPLCGDSRGLAALEQRLEVLHVLVFDRDEQAVVQLEASGADPPEDHVLLDALHRRLAVVDRVAPAAVEHPVVATRRAGGQLAPLDQRDAQAAQGEVMRERAAGATAAHDENVPVVPIGFHLKSSLRPDGPYGAAAAPPSGAGTRKGRVLSRDWSRCCDRAA